MLQSQKILGVSVTNEKKDKILEYFYDFIKKSPKKGFIITPNPEILVYAEKHPAYKKILNEATVALPDGIGILLGALILGNPFKERITGTDFMEKVIAESGEKLVSIGLLGAKPGVAEKAGDCLREKYPNCKIIFTASEWPEKHLEKKEIDVLFVAFGHPKQEEWIYAHLDRLPVKIAMGVGGAFDYLSGNVSRAPEIIRMFGLEWLYRLVREPWRLRRQLALVEFINYILREKMTKKSVSS